MVVELPLGVFDYWRDATEVFFQHHRTFRKHDFVEIVYGAFWGHLRPVGDDLIAQETVHEAADLFFLKTNTFR